VVGSCTLVNRDVPPGATAVGIPCRIIEITEPVTEE
jgi:acetyltransferase-like isoleucine patch superfamily enzyme